MKSFAKYMTGFNGALLSLAMLLPMASAATTYTYTNGTPAGAVGSPAYDDANFTKLLDNDTGTANALDGSWVGFQDGGTISDQITFVFDTSVTITSVSLNFLHEDAAAVSLPAVVTIDGTDFPTADFPDGEGFVSYAGSFTGSTLVVTLNPGNANWVFVNEAQFTTGSSSSTPEPASLMLVGLGISGIIFGQKRFRRRHVR